MVDPSVEDLDHECHVLGVVGRHVHDDVESLATEDLADLVVVGAVGFQPLDAVGKRRLGYPPVQDGHLVATAGQFVDEGQAVELGAAHDQDPQRLAGQETTPSQMSRSSDSGSASRSHSSSRFITRRWSGS